MPDKKKMERKWSSLCADFERAQNEHVVALGLLSAGIASASEVPRLANVHKRAWMLSDTHGPS